MALRSARLVHLVAAMAAAALAAVAVVPIAWAARAELAVAQTTAAIGGTYSVHGTNANGTKYTGTAVIKGDGKVYLVSWLIADGTTFKGKGTLTGTTLVVDWGQKYPVIYEVAADGTLHGTWDKGRAKETLVPQK